MLQMSVVRDVANKTLSRLLQFDVICLFVVQQIETVQLKWSQYFCCVSVGNINFV